MATTAVLACSLRGDGSGKAVPPQISSVGGKARSLILCREDDGFNVPGGFVSTVSFFGPWIRTVRGSNEWKALLAAPSDDDPTIKGRCDALVASCANLGLTAEQREVLESSIESVFGGATTPALVVIRSSSPEEDLVRTSFAGGYETVLGVPLRREEELVSAIRHTFAYVFDYRVVRYKRQNCIDLRNPVIVVIVQEQIDASASGMAFSLNPLNNCYDEAVVTSSFGLGESVVSGVVTPDTFVVEKVRREILSKTVAKKAVVRVLGASGGVREEIRERVEESLTDEQVLRLADLVTHAESQFGFPVDDEWAFGRKGEELHLLQGFDDPLSPLSMDVRQRILAAAVPSITNGPDGLAQWLHGRQYILLSNLLACPCGTALFRNFLLAPGGPTHRALESVDLEEYRSKTSSPKNRYVAWKLAKQLLSTVPVVLQSLWNPSKSMQAYNEMTDAVIRRYGVRGAEESSQSHSSAFLQEVDKCLATCQELFPLAAGFMVSYYSKWRLKMLFSGVDEAQDLLVALDMDLDGNPNLQVGHQMLRLAAFPEVQEAVTAKEFVAMLEAQACSNEFWTAYCHFIDRFGCCGPKEIDIATPRTHEEPGDLFRRLKLINVTDNQMLTVARRKQEAYWRLLELASQIGKALAFQYHASVNQRTGGYRDHLKYMFVFLIDYLRRRVLVQGEQWVRDGRLSRTDDIFFLPVEQITRSQQDPRLDLRELVAAQKAVYEAFGQVKKWPVLVDSRGRVFRASAPAPADGGGWGGDPISHGVARGRAKVLQTPFEKPIASGEILVTRATEPSWTPLFLNAGGLVLEVGGPLQHGAIVAREYGIPCVSGVDNATVQIRDGDWLEVDGTRGVVRILPDPRREREPTAPS